MHKFFDLRGQLDKKTTTMLSIIGFIIILLGWTFLSFFELVKPQLLPPPWKVLIAYYELHFKDALVRNLMYSISLNVMGYVEAVSVSLIVGFVLGLFPLFRGLFSRVINAVRFVPMTAVTGLCIAWFGIETNMKVQFLALGIMVYLIPVVVQRIDEVESVYEHTAITLGATVWQRIFHVYIPSVLSKLSDDIRVLTAISWTYIIVSELINAKGGIGALTWLASRQSRVDKIFAILVLIIVVGIVQDKILEKLDKLLFKHKYL